MGVRFQCPNGHKLHVKTELAGRRGLCPECGAKFVVPSFSGGRVPEDTGAVGPASSGAAVSSPPPTAVARSIQPPSPAAPAATSDSPAGAVIIKTHTPPPAAQPIAQPVAQPVATPVAQPIASPTASEPVAWYVRPPSGGQFGPATTEMFRQWIADGRVAADSWVWRTGWADWKAGSEALALAADRPPLDPAAAIAAALEDRVGAMPAVSTGSTTTAPSGVEAHTAEQRRLEIKRRKQRMQAISGLLALVALAMLMALVFVLVR